MGDTAVLTEAPGVLDHINNAANNGQQAATLIQPLADVEKSSNFITKVKNFPTAVKNAPANTWNFIKNIPQHTKNLASKTGEGVKNLPDTLSRAASSAKAGIKNIPAKTSEIVNKAATNIKAAPGNITQSIKNIPAKTSEVAGKTLDTVKAIPGKTKDFFNGLKGKFAKGGAAATDAAVDSSAAVIDTSGAALNGADTAIKATATTAKGAEALSTVAKVAGDLATPLMVVAGAAQTGIAIHKKDGHAAVKAAGGTTGGLLAGAAAATAFGIGTGGLGFIAEAAIGIGAFIGGSYAGSKASDKIAGNKFDKWLHRKDAVGAAANTAPALSNTAVGANGALVNATTGNPTDLNPDARTDFAARLRAERAQPRTNGVQV